MTSFQSMKSNNVPETAQEGDRVTTQYYEEVIRGVYIRGRV